MTELANRLDSNGFAVIPGPFDEKILDALANSIRTARTDSPSLRNRQRGGGLFAMRNILEIPTVAEIAVSSLLCGLIDDLLGANSFPVRGIFFDKPPGANWLVPWHQDLMIPIQEKREDAIGYRAWSRKDGVWHTLPPVEVLERMLTVRIHLDDCDADNGALQVIPGSHAHGRLTDTETDRWRQSHSPVTVCATRGDILLMRPLLLHASSASHEADTRQRRIVHLEYAAHPLPEGVQWATKSSLITSILPDSQV